MKKIGTAIFIMMMLPWGTASFVVAAEEKKAASVNTVEQSVTDLLSIRDNDSLSDEEKLAKEIDARTKILNGVLSLSQDEVKSLSDKLKALPEFVKDSREKELQDSFLKSLETYGAYYSEESKKLETLHTLSEIKSLAEEIKKYRDEVYNVEVQKIVEFTLVFYNENVLAVGNSRLDKISGDIKKLSGLGYIKPTAFKDQMAKAKGLFESAAKLQKDAKDIVLKAPEEIKPKDTNAENTNLPTESIPGAKNVESQKPVLPMDLMGDSLNKIKEAYNIFLQIGKDIRKILGIK